MDLFKDCLEGIVDLDDLTVYPEEWREMPVHDLFYKCMREAGRSLYYMDYLHRGIEFGTQHERVDVLCKECADIWHSVRYPNVEPDKEINEEEYRLSLMKWLYKFEDEVENQC